MRAGSLLMAVACAALCPRAARAEPAADDGSTRSRDRGIFYAGLGVTGAGLVTWFVAGTRVRAAEEDVDRLAFDVAREAQVPGDGPVIDVCGLAGDTEGQASAEARDVCARGERWQTTTNVAALVTLGSAAVTAYFGYRAFRGDPAPAAQRSAWHVQPVASPSAVGLGLDVAL